jgi:hypothetical protein
MMNQFGPERPVYDLTEDFRRFLIDPDEETFRSIFNRLLALGEVRGWLVSQMRVACCVNEAKGYQGEQGMSGVVESYIDKNFRSNLEVIKRAL